MSARPVRVMIRKRGVTDAQNKPLYSIVSTEHDLEIGPGESILGWFVPETPGVHGPSANMRSRMQDDADMQDDANEPWGGGGE